MGQQRIPAAKPVGVLDIGSNSVRLVIYERQALALTPLYNEKSPCALGRGVAETKKLPKKGVEHALIAIRRYALVAKLSNCRKVHILATSAVREAKDGRAFIAQVQKIMGARVRILSGTEEAHYAAMGVIAGMPGEYGIIGDLGGGSLELAQVTAAGDVLGETLALGAIRLQDDSKNSLRKARQVAKERIAVSKALRKSDGGTFHAIGGTWRSLAKLHQMRSRYPLHLIQHYRANAAEILTLCDAVMDGEISAKSVPGFDLISANRRDLLPYGCAVMGEILKSGNFKFVQFSALGLREGYLFDRLPAGEKKKDPLLEASRELAMINSRSVEHASDLERFTADFFAAAGIKESEADKRLRRAACLLSDIGWRGHPDYRGEQAVDMVAYGSFIGIDHPGRAFLAHALAVRYMGLKQQSISQEILALSTNGQARRARLLGACFEVGYLLSAARAGILPQASWAVKGGRLQLLMPKSLAFLAAEKMRRRLDQLAAELGLEAQVSIGVTVGRAA